jgi:hypothetical protein
MHYISKQKQGCFVTEQPLASNMCEFTITSLNYYNVKGLYIILFLFSQNSDAEFFFTFKFYITLLLITSEKSVKTLAKLEFFYIFSRFIKNQSIFLLSEYFSKTLSCEKNCGMISF